MSSSSPVWKKPSDVMRKIGQKKSSKSRNVAKKLDPDTEKNNTNNPRKYAANGKRKNPFGCSPRKRPQLSLELTGNDDPVNEQEQENGVLFSVLNTKDDECSAQSDTIVNDRKSPSKDKNLLKNKMEEAFLVQQGTNERLSKDEEPSPQGYGCYPVDWSLRLKLRYISSSSFSWCCPLKTVEEAKGIERFLHPNPSPLEKENLADIQKAELHKCCLYWVHPNISWLKLYPRMTSDNKIGKTSAVMQDKSVLDALMNDWTESFTSVFHLLRAGACSCFYLCCHQFTVGFWAAGVRFPSSPLQAIVTPTSRGFRENLKSEGIEFTLPHLPEKNLTEKSPERKSQPESAKASADTEVLVSEVEGQEDDSAKKEDDADDEDDVENTDEGAASWLETLGLDRKHYRTLDPNKVKLQRDSYKVIDNRPESSVLMTGTQVQALFNFLLNCRSCIANTGVQAGVPPTILAATAFQGATLKSLKVKQSIIRQQHSSEPAFSLEIVGPLLPSAYSSLNYLMSLTQKDYSAMYNVLDVSAPFNMANTCKTDNEDPESDRSSKYFPLAKESIRELTYSEDKFSWNKY